MEHLRPAKKVKQLNDQQAKRLPAKAKQVVGGSQEVPERPATGKVRVSPQTTRIIP